MPHGRRSRTADAVTVEGHHGLTMGAWGMWLTIVVLGTGVLGLAAAALYLQTGAPEWPPETIARPDVGRAVLSLVLATVACATTYVSRGWLRRDVDTGTAVLLMVSAALAAAATATLIVDIQALPFRWDEHAYASVYWVLTAGAATFLGISTLMLVAVLMQRLVGLVTPDHRLEADLTLMFLVFSTVVAAALLALVHLLPAVTTGETPPGTGRPTAPGEIIGEEGP